MDFSNERWLFVCAANLVRSPTAEYVARRRGYFATSAGAVANQGFAFSCVELTPELIEWADAIVCMEPAHVRRVEELNRRGHDVPIYCWNLPDRWRRPYHKELINECHERFSRTLKEHEEVKMAAAGNPDAAI